MNSDKLMEWSMAIMMFSVSLAIVAGVVVGIVEWLTGGFCK